MKAKAYLTSTKEEMYEIGERIGLHGEALETFCYALYEVSFDLEVDPATGNYEITHVDGRRLEPKG